MTDGQRIATNYRKLKLALREVVAIRNKTRYINDLAKALEKEEKIRTDIDRIKQVIAMLPKEIRYEIEKESDKTT